MKTTEKNDFGNWIDNLKIGIYPEIRKKIIVECKITPQIFRHWKNGNTKIPELAKPIINKIADTAIFKLSE
jgi:hypothetical protein